MPLSSNSLIHFTKEKDSLLGILESNFKVHYCKETITVGDETGDFYVPMVSFCDIPLSEIKNHIDSYGSYGVGLTKAWGTRKGLNPVLYTSHKSILATSIERALSAYILGGKIDKLEENQMALLDILRYMKNYEGPLSRRGISFDSYRYSDEREWRYVPKYTERCLMICSPSKYESQKTRIDRDIECMRLEFEPNDIKYVIINDDTEISEFIEHLRRAKGRKYSLHDIERLTTRILTVDQIRTDI